MTAREEIAGKPEAVQIVLKACMKRFSRKDRTPDWEMYGQQALAWWRGYMQWAPGRTEVDLAETILERLRRQPSAGNLLWRANKRDGL